MKLKAELIAVCLAPVVLSVAGCSQPEAETRTFAPPTELKAAPAGPHIELGWKHNATQPGGYWVEWGTSGDDFVKLGAAWSDHPDFRHPNVAPETRHLYRVVPFFGKPSPVVEITTGPAPTEELMHSESEGPLEMDTLAAIGLVSLKDEREGAATEESPGPSDSEPKHSVRSASTLPSAAPANLTAALSAVPVNVVLRWKDRAADEDGYLVEVSDQPDKDFRICALLPADARSFRKTMLPAETKLYFRVRAFFYGEPSEIAGVTVGQASESESTLPPML